jgi:predicted NACHT family NTPase
VLVGLPGAGKSTFLEWFQLQLADAMEELVLGEEQAIPLLLRVRELDPRHLPTGAALIAAATASPDRAALMPQGWIDRQMEAGRVIFMLDGLDETEPELLEDHILPWLEDLVTDYPRCHYLVSSRPVGYLRHPAPTRG